MDKDVKGYLLFVIVLFGCMFLGMSYENHTKNQCRVELAKAGKSADEIVKVCK